MKDQWKFFKLAFDRRAFTASRDENTFSYDYSIYSE